MFTAAGEDLLDYAGRIISLHDEALLLDLLNTTPVMAGDVIRRIHEGRSVGVLFNE